MNDKSTMKIIVSCLLMSETQAYEDDIMATRQVVFRTDLNASKPIIIRINNTQIYILMLLYGF